MRRRVATGTSPADARHHISMALTAAVTLIASWFAGTVYLLMPTLALRCLRDLVRSKRPIIVPPGFRWWLAFLGWSFASGMQLRAPDRILAFAYRGLMYLAATAIFVWLYNQQRETHKVESRVSSVILGFWLALVVGGLAGIVFAGREFTTLFSMMLPDSLGETRFIRDITTARLSYVTRFLGFPAARPTAPFAYTNEWASNFVLLSVAVGGLALSRMGRHRGLLLGIAVAAVLPFVYSLSRAAWATAILAAFLGCLGLLKMSQVSPRAVGRFLLGLLLVVVVLTRLGGLIDDRLATGHSDEARTARAGEALGRVQESPLIGFGAPLPPESGVGPSVGTHGQVWLVIFSSGFVGAAFFAIWWGCVLWRCRRLRNVTELVAATTVLVALAQSPFYEMLPFQLGLLMTLAALAFRGPECRNVVLFNPYRGSF